MKTVLAGLCLLIASTGFGQLTVTEKFQKIKNVQEAQQYIDANAPLKPEMFKLSYGKDSTLIAKRLLRQKTGDVFSVGYVTYKIVEGTESVNYRSSYIFLDGGSLTLPEIDSLKKLIVKRASAGEAFETLSDQYTMDGNKTHGDTGWFFGEETMPKEVQEAIKNHKLGEIFFVDIGEKQWHYIIKKTYDDQIKKEVTVLRSNGR